MMAEHFDDEVELAQVLPLLCDLQPHQVVVRELAGGGRLLRALRHQADVLLLVEHVHQHLETEKTKLSSSSFFQDETRTPSTLRGPNQVPRPPGPPFPHLVGAHGHLDVLLADLVVPYVAHIVARQLQYVC